MKYALMFLQMIPAIITAIKEIEAFLPSSGFGKEKLASIRDSLSKIFKEIDAVWPAIETLVGALVKLANETIWKKKAEPEITE